LEKVVAVLAEKEEEIATTAWFEKNVHRRFSLNFSSFEHSSVLFPLIRKKEHLGTSNFSALLFLKKGKNFCPPRSQ
jgi:hypothetical protein